MRNLFLETNELRSGTIRNGGKGGPNWTRPPESSVSHTVLLANKTPHSFQMKCQIHFHIFLKKILFWRNLNENEIGAIICGRLKWTAHIGTSWPWTRGRTSPRLKWCHGAGALVQTEKRTLRALEDVQSVERRCFGNVSFSVIFILFFFFKKKKEDE